MDKNGMSWRPLADMESDGIRFTDEQKIVLNEIREESICSYSGLPSLKSYINETDKDRWTRQD